jgi:hypothetical protein
MRLFVYEGHSIAQDAPWHGRDAERKTEPSLALRLDLDPHKIAESV